MTPFRPTTFTVSLNGGIPLADLTYTPLFDPLQSTTGTIGSRIWPGLEFEDAADDQPEVLAHSRELRLLGRLAPGGLALLGGYRLEGSENASLNWAITDDVSGAGVAANYQDFNVDGFYLNLNEGPPFPVHSALQMKVDTLSGSAPEPSTWAMMLIGFAGLVAAGIRKAPRQAEA